MGETGVPCLVRTNPESSRAVTIATFAISTNWKPNRLFPRVSLLLVADISDPWLTVIDFNTSADVLTIGWVKYRYNFRFFGLLVAWTNLTLLSSGSSCSGIRVLRSTYTSLLSVKSKNQLTSYQYPLTFLRTYFQRNYSHQNERRTRKPLFL